MNVYWLLDLSISGTVYRLAEVDLDVQTDAGLWLHYDAGLEVEPVTESISILSASATQPEASVRIWLDGVATVAILRARGDLARWVDGTTYERRRRVVAGPCQSPESESPEEGITTTISGDEWRDGATMITATQSITTATWTRSGQIATLTDGDQATPYPIIIGRPGRLPSSGATGNEVQIPAMVAPWLYHGPQSPADIDLDGWVGLRPCALLLAGHHISVTQVWLTTETDTVGSWFHVLNTLDSLGNPVAVVPFYFDLSLVPNDIYGDTGTYHYGNSAVPVVSSATSIFGLGHPGLEPAFNVDTAQPAIYASYPASRNGVSNGDAVSAGGVTWGGVAIRAAGDVLSWALSQASAGVDLARMSAALDALQSYQIDTVITDRDESGPWKWVSSVLLPILPCSLASGPAGIYIVPLALDAVEADCVARLDSRRPDIEARAIRWDTSRLAKSVTVKSRYNVKTAVHTASVTYASTAAVRAAPITTTILAHPSFDLAESWGLRGQDLVIETAAVYDTPTAYLIAYTLARLRALPVARLTFDLPEDDDQFFALERGSIVYAYDAPSGVDRVAQIESIETPGDGSLIVTVWWIIDPSKGTIV